MLIVGKKYLLTKPKDTQEHPIWVSEMDSLNGMVVTVVSIGSPLSRLGSSIYIKEDYGKFKYNERWFSQSKMRQNLFIQSLC